MDKLICEDKIMYARLFFYMEGERNSIKLAYKNSILIEKEYTYKL